MIPPASDVVPDDGKRRRLLVIVAGGLVLSLAFVAVSSYSDRRVSQEDDRIRQRAAGVSIAPTAVIDAVYGGGNQIADDLGIAPGRVTLTADSSELCITITSSYLVAERVTSFEVRDGALSPTDGC